VAIVVALLDAFQVNLNASDGDRNFEPICARESFFDGNHTHGISSSSCGRHILIHLQETRATQFFQSPVSRQSSISVAGKFA
jgi:hypothetical protein